MYGGIQALRTAYRKKFLTTQDSTLSIFQQNPPVFVDAKKPPFGSVPVASCDGIGICFIYRKKRNTKYLVEKQRPVREFLICLEQPEVTWG